jgi:type I restriction-modification system DNA methylase subunit
MITKEEAVKKIKSLVERFDEQKEFYRKAEYNETQTRRDFIDPFWKALGWDVDNENGYAESYREVIHEDRIKVGGATKAPDYSFRLPGGKRLFFLEAKKPSVSIKEDTEPAYQSRRYGGSAKMPISVISDFEEFAIYDCTNKPKPTDKASNGRIKYITYTDYLNEFDFIWDTFSKERVLKGSFDKYITSDKNKKGTTTVDHDFLASLDKWRIELAKNIVLRNKNLNEDELNFVVQHTIDRIIFLRIAEDRHVERYGELQDAIKNGDYYKNLLLHFNVADQKYNSGLFDFQKDKISTEIAIDNKVIKSIISELYYPLCPYEFSVLSVEILGSAYEQFLGKTITLSSSGKTAKIEEKPEVRKAGGVYYTPQYIVDYIVQNTVGKLIVNKTPEEVSKIKIVDPACGSGSFLIGAYSYLLNWHKDFYTQNGKQSKGHKNNPLTPTSELTTAAKKRILLNNIFGVDLDSNAVEVTKLSLLLKCMEGETKETIEAQSKIFHDRILPTLDNNIKSGNSLIGLDYYDSQLDFGEERKIKPFSWKKNFPEVFAQGGFDCVIGNPPYVRSQHIDENIKKYLVSKYATSSAYQPDLFAFFIDKGIGLLNQNGLLGFIIPNGILTNSYYAKSRQNILNSTSVKIIVDLKDKVFEGASVDTSIFILEKETNNEKRNDNKMLIGEYPAKTRLAVETPSNHIVQSELLKVKDFIFNTSSSSDDLAFVKKLTTNSIRLGDLCLIKNGMKVRKDFVATSKIDTRYKQFLLGASVKPYLIDYKNKWVCYDKTLENKFSNQAFREEEIFLKNPKILVRQVMGKERLFATIDDKAFYADQSVYILLPKNEKVNLHFILGLLNSKLLYYFFSKTFSDRKETFPKIKGIQLAEFPIKQTANQEQIIKHVEHLLQLNKDLQTATLPSQKEQIQRRISYCEDRINAVVYELYELTEEEIRIIEK